MSQEKGGTAAATLESYRTARVHILGILARAGNQPATLDLVQWAEALTECLWRELELRQALESGHLPDGDADSPAQ